MGQSGPEYFRPRMKRCDNVLSDAHVVPSSPSTGKPVVWTVECISTKGDIHHCCIFQWVLHHYSDFRRAELFRCLMVPFEVTEPTGGGLYISPLRQLHSNYLKTTAGFSQFCKICPRIHPDISIRHTEGSSACYNSSNSDESAGGFHLNLTGSLTNICQSGLQ